MVRRTAFMSTMIAAAVLIACAAVLLGIPETAEAAFPGRNGKIAFSSDLNVGEGVNNPEGDAEIFTIAPDGTDLTQLTRNDTDDRTPDWAADGERIAYSGYDGNDYEIYTVSAAGAATIQLTDNTDDDSSPAFSPEGAQIAYEGVAPINEEIPDWKVRRIYTIPSSGGTPSVVVESNADGPYYGPYDPDWSPSGNEIAYSRLAEGGEGYSRVEVLNLTSGLSSTVTPQVYSVFSERRPEWSPDGSRIAYEGYDRDEDLGGGPEADPMDIYAVGASGGTLVKLTNASTRGERSPAWSPDGSRIAFSAQNSGVTLGQALYTMPADGGTAINITGGQEMGHIESLDWQPVPLRPLGPTSKAECKKGGYKEFGFKKQGKCVAFVNRAVHSR